MTQPRAATSAPPRRPAAVAPPALPALMTTDEVAAQLRVDPYTVRKYARTGLLPAYRVGRELRYAAADVAAFLEGLVVPQPAPASTSSGRARRAPSAAEV